jgi:hypothetical protein
VDERAREAGTPREQLVPTWVRNLGGKEGHGFVGGIKPLERRRRAARLYGEAQERKGRRKLRSDPWRGGKLWRGNPRSAGG